MRKTWKIHFKPPNGWLTAPCGVRPRHGNVTTKQKKVTCYPCLMKYWEAEMYKVIEK